MCWLWIDRQLSLTSFDHTLQRSHVPKMQPQQTNTPMYYQPNPIPVSSCCLTATRWMQGLDEQSVALLLLALWHKRTCSENIYYVAVAFELLSAGSGLLPQLFRLVHLPTGAGDVAGSPLSAGPIRYARQF